MIAKLRFNTLGTGSIDSRNIYGSTYAVLNTVSPDFESGWINIYSTPIKNSMKVESNNPDKGGTYFYITLITGTNRSIKICLDAIRQYKLPDIFYVKISKK